MTNIFLLACSIIDKSKIDPEIMLILTTKISVL